jgi:hypothetical protein
MMGYRDPVSNLFCVTFDNASVMGKFYANLQNMDKADIAILMQKYVQEQVRSNYYTNKLIDNASQVFYNVGDFVKATANDNSYLIDGNVYINDVGPFGECAKIRPVKFLTPYEKVTCGFKIVNLFNNRNQ